MVITLGLLFLPNVKSTPTQSFTYSQFVAAVKSGKVKTASINSNGGVSGSLKAGDDYTSQIPTALVDNSLVGVLESNNVDITGVGPSSSLGEDLLSLLPLVFFIGLFIWFGRRTRKQLAGGIMGIGGSKAKLYDEDRPATRFSDVAGYEGAKQEVGEVVDFLKNPERYARRRGDRTERCPHGRAAGNR